MSLLAATQREFLAEIAGADDDREPSSQGMAIYRNAYRARLCGALETSFARTRSWVGEQAFAQAAAHYIIARPPSSWTLDAYGTDFPELMTELFAEDEEVGELTWLEWHLQDAFAATDAATLTAADLAEAQATEQDWLNLRLAMAPGFAWRTVAFDIPALWRNLGDGTDQGAPARLPSPAVLLVWRSELQPQYRLIDADEMVPLEHLAAGPSFGEVAQTLNGQDPELFGRWFAGWLGAGLFVSGNSVNRA